MRALAGRSGVGTCAAAAPRRPAPTRGRRPVTGALPAERGSAASAAGLGSGWGVEVPGEPAQQQQGRAAKQRAKLEPGQAPPQPASAAGAAPGPPPGSAGGKRRSKRTSTPFVSMQTPEGQLGLAMLQQSLSMEEGNQRPEGRAVLQQDQQLVAPTIAELKATLAATGPGGKRRVSAAGAALGGAMPLRQRGPTADDGEGIDEQDELGGVPSFQLSLTASGTVRLCNRAHAVQDVTAVCYGSLLHSPRTSAAPTHPLSTAPATSLQLCRSWLIWTQRAAPSLGVATMQWMGRTALLWT